MEEKFSNHKIYAIVQALVNHMSAPTEMGYADSLPDTLCI